MTIMMEVKITGTKDEVMEMLSGGASQQKLTATDDKVDATPKVITKEFKEGEKVTVQNRAVVSTRTGKPTQLENEAPKRAVPKPKPAVQQELEEYEEEEEETPTPPKPQPKPKPKPQPQPVDEDEEEDGDYEFED